MRLIRAPDVVPRRLGLLPGSFNPPTRAHVALAEAALETVDEVLLVLPGTLPHKNFTEGATPEQRLEMLHRLAQSHSRLGAAVSEGGLYIDIAREAKLLFPEAELYVVCGRDAAERIVGWDYGDPGAIERFLQEFRLLVAQREGHWQPPEHLSVSVEFLAAGNWDACASTLVREGATNWRKLVPEQIADLVEAIYSLADASRNVRSR